MLQSVSLWRTVQLFSNRSYWLECPGGTVVYSTDHQPQHPWFKSSLGPLCMSFPISLLSNCWWRHENQSAKISDSLVGLPLKWASIVTSIYKYLIIHFNEAQATCELNYVFPVLMWVCSVLWQIRGSHLTFVQLGPVNVLGQPADTGMYCVFLYPPSVVISLISTILNCFPTSLFLNHILS